MTKTTSNQSNGFDAFMEASGMSRAALQQSLDQMQTALEALPTDMNGTLLIYFIDGLRKAYSLSPEAWLAMLTEVASHTEGVTIVTETNEPCTCEECVDARRDDDEFATVSLLH